MKSFIPNAAMVHTHSFGHVPRLDGAANHDSRKMVDPIVLIDDEVVKISAILLQPVSAPDLSQNHKPDVVLKPGDVSVIYVCELPEIKGKFDPKKAAALGLRPGPKYRELQLGNSVKSDNQDIMVNRTCTTLYIVSCFCCAWFSHVITLALLRFIPAMC